MDLIAASGFFFATLLVFAAGAIGSLIAGRQDRAANLWGNGMAAVGSAAGLAFSGAILLGDEPLSFGVSSSFPLLDLDFTLDRLAAFFMAVICLVALLCSIYALGYVRHYFGKYSIGALGFFFNIFIASMILVVSAGNALLFLIVWELMSIASYFLVIYERREAASIRAGSIYFIMTHAGTAFILLSFLLIFQQAGSFDFSAIRGGLEGASPWLISAIFLSALVGFGVKAGIIPLHIWLPGAHPAAPSHVSALMSGVMIKTGIYMLIRFTLDFLPGTTLWWGLLLLLTGAASSLLGVLYALSEHDLKRLLAYSSIENIGIILLGLGSAVAFTAMDMKVPAALGLAAALFHTLNHATFKALLFMGAGSVIAGTHTRNIEKYGGLIRLMPQTALFFLAGSMAISALPPFNGFFSEWLTFQSLFQGVAAFDSLTKVIFILCAGALAFTSGLAAACFVKAFGITFLARTRSEAAAGAREAAMLSRLSMAAMAVLTLALGLLSGAVLPVLQKTAAATASLPGTQASQAAALGEVSLQGGFAEASMPAVFVGLATAAVAVASAAYVLNRRRRTVTGRTWDCGSDLTPRMEITATGFSRSIITVSHRLLRPSSETEIEYHDANPYFPKRGTVTMGLRDVYQPLIYRPLKELTNMIAGYVRKVQSGNVNSYILYIFLTLIALLFLLDVGS